MDVKSKSTISNISEASIICLKKFELRISKPVADAAEFEAAARRFLAWANMLKVFSKSASLDIQLQLGKYQHIRRMVLLLLEVLEENLSLSLETATEVGRAASAFGIEETLKRLEKIALVILQATQGSMIKRALAFAAKHPDLETLSRSFSIVILGRYPKLAPSDSLRTIHSPVSDYTPVPENTPVLERDVPSVTNIMALSPEGLFLALVKTCLVRHFRILYERNRRKREKNDVEIPAVVLQSPQNFEPEEEHSNQSSHPLPRTDVAAAHVTKPYPESNSEAPSEPPLTLLSLNSRQLEEGISGAEPGGTGGHGKHTPISEAGVAFYPRAPKVPDGANEITCPICKQEFPPNELKGFHWRRHLLTDIKPYACIFQDCMSNMQFFENFRSWIDHIHKAHTPLWIRHLYKPIVWNCSLCDLPSNMEFFSKNRMENHFIRHLKAIHPEVAHNEYQQLVSSSAATQPRPSAICPICGKQAEENFVTEPALPSKETEVNDAAGARDFQDGFATRNRKAAKKGKVEFAVPETLGDDEDEMDSDATERATTSGRHQTRAMHDHSVEKCIAGHLKGMAFFFSNYLIDGGEQDEVQQSNSDIPQSQQSDHNIDDDEDLLKEIVEEQSPKLPSGDYTEIDRLTIPDGEKDEMKKCIAKNLEILCGTAHAQMGWNYDWVNGWRVIEPNIPKEEARRLFPGNDGEGNGMVWKGLEIKYLPAYFSCTFLITELCRKALTASDIERKVDRPRIQGHISDAESFSRVQEDISRNFYPLGAVQKSRFVLALEECVKEVEEIRAKLSLLISMSAPTLTKKLLRIERMLYFNFGLAGLDGHFQDIPYVDVTPILEAHFEGVNKTAVESVISGIRGGRPDIATVVRDVCSTLAEVRANAMQGSVIPETMDNFLDLFEPPPRPFAHIPFPRDEHFVNRGDLLEVLDKKCTESPSRVAIAGLPGIGKSQLAIEYAYRISKEQDSLWVFWVDAGTRTGVYEGLRNIANNVKLVGRNRPYANIPQLVHDWLSSERSGRWVMVLDGADDHNVFSEVVEDGQPLVACLPQTGDGCIIVTTYNKDLARLLTGKRENVIHLGQMAETEAVNLLQNKLGSLDPGLPVATDLVKKLELFPLVISQAASMIQSRELTVKSFQSQFLEVESNSLRFLQLNVVDPRRDKSRSNAMFTILQNVLEYIRSRWPSAADLLSLMSFFESYNWIPKWVLAVKKTSQHATHAVDQAADINDTESEGSAAAMVKQGGEPGSTIRNSMDDNLEANLAILQDHGLITVNGTDEEFGTFWFVQLFLKKLLQASEQYETFKQLYIEKMSASFPTGDYENWKICHKLSMHAQKAFKYRSGAVGFEQWATLMHNGGWYAWSQGNYEIAEKMLHEALVTRKQRLGDEDEATLVSMALFAMVIMDRGRWEEGEMLFKQVMNTRTALLGTDHLETLKSMSNLASAYMIQGRWEEAELLQMQVLETSRVKLGFLHLNTITSMANLAGVYSEQGRWLEAKKLHTQVMELRETRLGYDHPDTLKSMANRALTLKNLGRWWEAKALEGRVMRIRKSKLGPYHPDSLSSLANMASILKDQGQSQEAEGLELLVLKARTATLGPYHPSTLTSVGNLASTLRNQGRWVEAEKLDVQVMRKRKATLGIKHPYTLSSMGNLASTIRKQGRLLEAEDLEVQVLEARKTKLGPEHPYTLTNLGNLAVTYGDQTRWEEAEELEVEVMEKRKAIHGTEHPLTLTSMANLAFTWKNLGRDKDALGLMETCVQDRQRVLGNDHPDTLASIALLHEWYDQEVDSGPGEQISQGPAQLADNEDSGDTT